MHIRKISFNGMGVYREKQEFDFTPVSGNGIVDNLETFGLERNIPDFSAYKQIVFVGRNASGKTSTLMGIAFALGLLAEPMRYAAGLQRIRNAFSTADPINVKMEIVTNGNGKDSLVDKYLIEYTLDSGSFVYESVKFASAKKTTKTEYVELYKYKNGHFYFEGQKTALQHNPLSSFFSLLRSGFVIKEFQKIIKRHPIFRLLNTKNEFETRGNIFEALEFPKLQEHKELFKKLLERVDPNIKDIFVDQEGQINVKIANNGDIEKVKGPQVFDMISNGTSLFLRSIKFIVSGFYEGNITLFDEFGKSIHGGLISLFFEVFKRSKNQTILTTHSEDIFKQNIRFEQIFNIKNKDGNISVERMSDYDIDSRNRSIKAIRRELDNEPSSDEIVDILELMEKLSNV